MSSYYGVSHIEKLTLLPETLEHGRAYFVDDEQVIVIDHGQGAVIYGGKPGPQGTAGEPSELVQSQIDNLADASLNTQSNIWYLIQRSDNRYQELTENISAEASLRENADDSLDGRISQEVNTLNEAITAEETLRIAADDSLDERISQEVNTLNASISTAAQQALKDTEHYAQSLSNRADHLQDQVDNNSSAILSLISTLQNKFSELTYIHLLLHNPILGIDPFFQIISMALCVCGMLCIHSVSDAAHAHLDRLHCRRDRHAPFVRTKKKAAAFNRCFSHHRFLRRKHQTSGSILLSALRL